jgi:DNA ligase-1
MLVYDGFAPEGCEVSEKYDGICAIWDGQDLKTRDGNKLAAPNWFIAGLPPVHLRGELWCGRGQFEQVLSICKSQSSGTRWQQVVYMVFDCETDLTIGDYAKRVKRQTVSSIQELNAMLQEIIANGGEGVVIRDKSGTEFKYKPISDDDAVVVGHAEGSGKNMGRCGALIVRDRDGCEFRLGSGLSDEIREVPPKVGEVVKFSYQGRTRTGKPRFASFLSVRAELSLDFVNS